MDRTERFYKIDKLLKEMKSIPLRRFVEKQIKVSHLAARPVPKNHFPVIMTALEEGRYLLCLPYSHDPELLMDIMRYGPEVEVLKPESLRQKVKELLELTLKHYQSQPITSN